MIYIMGTFDKFHEAIQGLPDERRATKWLAFYSILIWAPLGPLLAFTLMEPKDVPVWVPFAGILVTSCFGVVGTFIAFHLFGFRLLAATAAGLFWLVIGFGAGGAILFAFHYWKVDIGMWPFVLSPIFGIVAFVHRLRTPAARSIGKLGAVYRTDYTGRPFLVRGNLTREEAEQVVNEFTARGHKQYYWVECENQK